MITSADAAIFGSASVLPIRVLADMIFVEILLKFSFIRSPCCCILLAVLVSADDTLLNTWLPSLMPS